MEYLIIGERNNGYRCHCCRQTWQDTYEMDFDSDEEALEYSKTCDNEDFELINIYQIGEKIYGN